MKNMNLKTNLVRLALAGALAFAGCGKSKPRVTDEERYSHALASYYADTPIENGLSRLYPFKDRNGDFGMMVRSKENNEEALFYDLDKNGDLETIEADYVIGRFNRKGQLPENVKKVNDDLGSTADFYYKRFWREYSKIFE